jgi:hypothetical protein
MLETRGQNSTQSKRAVLQAAVLAPAHDAGLRGLAEAKAAAELARHIVEAEQARDTLIADEAKNVGARTTAAGSAADEGERNPDMIPILIGIGLGSVALVAFGGIATLMGLWR